AALDHQHQCVVRHFHWSCDYLDHGQSGEFTSELWHDYGLWKFFAACPNSCHLPFGYIERPNGRHALPLPSAIGGLDWNCRNLSRSHVLNQQRFFLLPLLDLEQLEYSRHTI